MSDIAGRLGKKTDSVWFASRSEKVKTSINSKLFNRQKRIYVDGEGSNHSSIHANMFPLAFGIVPDYAVKSVVEFIKTRGMACSVYGAQFLLEGLYKVCEADYAFSLLTSTTDRSWWNMIRSGSTITMEAWDMKYKPNSDWNHAWGTAPANIITRWMWGIKPAEPGFTKALICPQLSGLTWAEITAPTIKGSIHAQFTRLENGDEKYNFIIPDEMSGALLFFSGQNIKIIINGRTTKYKTSGLNLSPGSYEIIVRRKQS